MNKTGQVTSQNHDNLYLYNSYNDVNLYVRLSMHWRLKSPTYDG